MRIVPFTFSFRRSVFFLGFVFLAFLFSKNANAQGQPSRIDTSKVQSIPTQPVGSNQTSSSVNQTSSSTNQTAVGANQTPSGIQLPRQTATDNYKVFQRPPSNIFGSELFSTGSLSFQPNLRIATPVNYVLGPDDELLINVSGYQETTVKATVLPEGTIFIPQVGKINVNGLSIEAATSLINNRMSQTAYQSLRNGTSKLTITLSNIKSIHVTIIGGYKPGNYTVSSLTTLFNALYLCGGPGDINTYRDIQLIRGGRIIDKMDLYQFLTKGEIQGNVLLKEGDVINMPIYTKHVSITGQVKKPGTFELKNNETFSDLLFFAGGYTDIAYKASVKVKQINDVERSIKDIPKAQLSTYIPSNGDAFTVDAVLDRYVNAVTINGAVYRPGEFEITPGLSVSGLIKKAGGLTENVFTERALVNRNYPDGRKEVMTFNVTRLLNGSDPDISLLKGDIVTIATATQFKNTYSVTILGEVKNPGSFPYSENLTLKDVFFLANGFTDAASSYHVEVSRRLTAERANKSADTIAKVFDFATTKDLEIDRNKFLLQPFDVITVRRNPGYIEQQRVTITGEVNYPGSYTIKSKKDRISDLLKRAGGLTSEAYPKGMFLLRNDIANLAQSTTIRNIQRSIRDTSNAVVEEIVRTNNRIAVDLSKVLNEPGSVEDYVLLDGDQIQVLKTDPLVKVNGEVQYATKTSFVEGKSLKYYIGQAGGFSQFAKRKKTFVIYANGDTKRTHNGFLGLFRSYPPVEEGAEIVVPKKVVQKGGGLSLAEITAITTSVVSLASLLVITISTLRK